MRGIVPAAAARRLRDEDVPPLGRDRHVDAGHAADLARPRAGGVDDDAASRCGPRSCCTLVHAAVGDRDARHLLAAHDLDAARLRRAREPHRHAVRIGDAVVAAEGRAEHAVDVEMPGAEPRRLGRREPVDGDAVRALQRDVALERRDALVGDESRKRYPSGQKSIGEPTASSKLAKSAIDSFDSSMLAACEN